MLQLDEIRMLLVNKRQPVSRGQISGFRLSLLRYSKLHLRLEDDPSSSSLIRLYHQCLGGRRWPSTEHGDADSWAHDKSNLIPRGDMGTHPIPAVLVIPGEATYSLSGRTDPRGRQLCAKRQDRPSSPAYLYRASYSDMRTRAGRRLSCVESVSRMRMIEKTCWLEAQAYRSMADTGHETRRCPFTSAASRLYHFRAQIDRKTSPGQTASRAVNGTDSTDRKDW